LFQFKEEQYLSILTKSMTKLNLKNKCRNQIRTLPTWDCHITLLLSCYTTMQSGTTWSDMCQNKIPKQKIKKK